MSITKDSILTSVITSAIVAGSFVLAPSLIEDETPIVEQFLDDKYENYELEADEIITYVSLKEDDLEFKAELLSKFDKDEIKKIDDAALTYYLSDAETKNYMKDKLKTKYEKFIPYAETHLFAALLEEEQSTDYKEIVEGLIDKVESENITRQDEIILINKLMTDFKIEKINESYHVFIDNDWVDLGVSDGLPIELAMKAMRKRLEKIN